MAHRGTISMCLWMWGFPFVRICVWVGELSCAVLCCAALCCVVLSCAELRCAVLFWATLCCAELAALSWAVLRWAVLSCGVLTVEEDMVDWVTLNPWKLHESLNPKLNQWRRLATWYNNIWVIPDWWRLSPHRRYNLWRRGNIGDTARRLQDYSGSHSTS